jgi:hypothetical protein
MGKKTKKSKKNQRLCKKTRRVKYRRVGGTRKKLATIVPQSVVDKENKSYTVPPSSLYTFSVKDKTPLYRRATPLSPGKWAKTNSRLPPEF